MVCRSRERKGGVCVWGGMEGKGVGGGVGE